MTVGKKLSIAFYLIIGIMVVSTILNYKNLEKIDENQTYAFDHRVNRILLVEEIRYNLSQQGLYLRAYFLEKTPENRKALENHADADNATELQHEVQRFKV